MAFPAAPCETPDIPDGCCTVLWDQGVEILTAVAGPVLACVARTDCCGGSLRGFVSLGRPETWQFDTITVFLENISLAPGGTTAQGITIQPPSIRALWRVNLLESCYPGWVQQGDQTFTPDDDELHAANHHGYVHGEALLRGVIMFAASQVCTGFVLRDFQPIQPLSNTAGWTVGLGLDLNL